MFRCPETSRTLTCPRLCLGNFELLFRSEFHLKEIDPTVRNAFSKVSVNSVVRLPMTVFSN